MVLSSSWRLGTTIRTLDQDRLSTGRQSPGLNGFSCAAESDSEAAGKPAVPDGSNAGHDEAPRGVQPEQGLQEMNAN